MVSFNEYMSESKLFNRWAVLKIALYGGFCGALLTAGFMIVSFMV